MVNSAEKRQSIRELTADGTLGDADVVLARCTEIVRASATNVHTPVASADPDMQMLQIALAKAGVDAAVIANFTATLSKQSKGKSRGGGKSAAKEDQPNKFRLPEGQKCSKGTCSLNHDKFSPGTPCFRDPGFLGPPPQNYRKNQRQIQRLEEARKANAVRMGVPYKPMILSTPPTAAAVAAIADDAMDAVANDFFQLPTSLCPVLPVFGAVAGPVCTPCEDESQWDFSDDEEFSDESPTALHQSSDFDVGPESYLTPTRGRGVLTGGAVGSSAWQSDHCEAQWVGSSDDDDDVEPPPPPAKPLPTRTRAPSPATVPAPGTTYAGTHRRQVFPTFEGSHDDVAADAFISIRDEPTFSSTRGIKGRPATPCANTSPNLPSAAAEVAADRPKLLRTAAMPAAMVPAALPGPWPARGARVRPPAARLRNWLSSRSSSSPASASLVLLSAPSAFLSCR